MLDRGLYVAGRLWRRPLGRALALAVRGEVADAQRLLHRERELAERGLGRIDAISQIATSLGLFGTVLGLAQSFLSSGQSEGGNRLGLAAPEVLAEGLSTALFTTVAGLVVFLFGQAFLIAYREGLALRERSVRLLVEERGAQ
ncbi:MAG: MotA/TolQ/ExbB proton channel family protein [Planctomycetota bacterium]